MAAQDLCVLEDVRALMQKAVSDTTQDALINSQITRASDAIMRFVDRQFAPQQTAVTKSFEWPWEGEFVSLAPYDLVGQPTTVTVDADQPAGGIVISADEFRVWPNPPRDGVYLALRIRPFSAVLGRIMWRNRRVDVMGNWGFPVIPTDVVEACAMTVVHWVTVFGAQQRWMDPAQVEQQPPRRGIPWEAKELLFPFKRSYTA